MEAGLRHILEGHSPNPDHGSIIDPDKVPYRCSPVTWAGNLGNRESLAAFHLDNVPYLLITDTGDNYRWRSQSRLLIMREPDA